MGSRKQSLEHKAFISDKLKKFYAKGCPRCTTELKCGSHKGKKCPEGCNCSHHSKEAREKNRLWHIGKPIWNLGLTKEMDARVRLGSERMKLTKNASTWKSPIPWCKGKTKYTDPRLWKISNVQKDLDHTKGVEAAAIYNRGKSKPRPDLLGKHLSEATRKKLSSVLREGYASGRIKMHLPPRNKWTQYGGINFRSTWEAKVAKFLDEIGEKWEYESERCRFVIDIDGNKHRYTIDFYLPRINTYVEVKGKVRGVEDSSRYFIFVKQFPNIKSAIIRGNSSKNTVDIQSVRNLLEVKS